MIGRLRMHRSMPSLQMMMGIDLRLSLRRLNMTRSRGLTTTPSTQRGKALASQEDQQPQCYGCFPAHFVILAAHRRSKTRWSILASADSLGVAGLMVSD